jgi:hypothetical protein
MKKPKSSRGKSDRTSREVGSNLDQTVKDAPAEKGGIFAALRSSPMVGADLDFTRVRTTGRKIRL